MQTKRKVHESKTKLGNSSIYFILKKQYRMLTITVVSALYISSVHFSWNFWSSLSHGIRLICNAMSKSKSTVPLMVSCSFVYHRHNKQCTFKTPFSDTLSPLATKIGKLISKPQTYVHLLMPIAPLGA